MSTDTHAALAAPAEPPLRPLPFAFAKRHGVLLREPFGQAQLQVRRGASLTAVQEAQRFAGRVLPLHWLEPEAFEQELTLALSLIHI